MATQGGIIPVNNETNATSSRITRNGKQITYCMKVLQQPERARACGSGAKCMFFVIVHLLPLILTSITASADRRPVDPPPIVELRVFEGPNKENDITLTYRANFFLFATLDNARYIQHGRVQQQPPALPVLTGTPVAGMAYLERPKPAGYFIFPDLSVRHEGKYRLGFSLYEELRDADDMDTETAANAEKVKNPHVSHRLEVKSQPFTVFSAKRFPGLAESTPLSRVFAEQGCRVRIRRDVRMRRRNTDGKAGRDYDEEYDEHSYDRARVSATPDRYPQHIATPHQTPVDHMDRPRSSSNTSLTYGHSRRPSHEQLAPQYPPSYAGSPQTPQGLYPTQNPVASWGTAPQQMNYAPPTQYPHQSYTAPQSTGMPPPAFGYATPAYSPEHSHARSGSIEYPAPPTGPPRHNSTPSTQAPPYPQNHAATYPPPANSQYNQSPPIRSYSQAPIASPASYAPTTTLPKLEAALAASPTYQNQSQPKLEPSPNYAFDSSSTLVAGSKRAYDKSFDTQALEGPLRYGARPEAISIEPRFNNGYGSGSSDGDEGMDASAMSYRRADGSQRRRRIPSAAA